ESGDWYRLHPPGIRSYALALLRVRWRLLRAHGDWMEAAARPGETVRLNERILAAIAEAARAARVPVVFVIFRSRSELEREGWRVAFLKRVFDTLGVRSIDTRPALVDAARRLGLATLYLPDGHLSTAGNAVVAEALTGVLQEVAGSRAAPHATLRGIPLIGREAGANLNVNARRSATRCEPRTSSRGSSSP